MGNEASMEGVEGGLAGLPEGVVGDGKGGFVQIPAGMEADLSQLSEEEKKQIAAVMSRAQGLQPGNAKDPPIERKPELGATHQPRQPGKPPDQGPSGITKSQTTNVFKTEKPKPGRSPSSISLLESRSRPEVKEDPKAAMMPSFLSEGNPLSAMSSVVNKFSLFGDAEETQEEALKKQKGAQQQKAQSQQPGPTKAAQQQGSPKLTQQQQGPSRPGPQQQAGPIHPQQQGPPKTGPQQQGPAKTGPQQQGPPLTGPQQQGPAKTGPQQQGPAKTGPQQQGPAKTGPQQQGPAKTGPQEQGPPKTGPQQQGPAKTGPQQQGPSETGPQQRGPAKTGPHQQGPAKTGPQEQGPAETGPQQQGPAKTGPQQQGPPKTGPPQQGPAKTGPPQQGPAKTGPPQQWPAKTGLPQQEPTKTGPPQQGPAKTGPPQQGPAKTGPPQQGPAKTGPPQQGPAKTGPQQKGPPKTGPQQQGPPLTGPQQQGPAKPGPKQGPAKPGPQQQGAAKPGPQQSPPNHGPQQQSPVKSGLQQQGPVKLGPQQQGPAKSPFQQPDHRKDPSKQESLSSQSQGPPSSSTPAHKKTHCPLCTTTELLLHTPEKANYNTCTQCHIVVCSQCGFNPNPHMTEVKEWLCLNCQVQRAMGMDVSGPPMAKPQPQQPKQQVTPGSPQKGKHGSPVPALQKSERSKTPEPKKPSPLTKQQSMSSSPPIKPKQPLSDSLTQKPAQQKDSTPKPDPSRPQEDTKQKQTGMQKPPDQTVSTSPAPGIKQASQVPQGPPPTQQKQPTQVQDATKPTSQPPQAGVKQMQPDSKLQPQQKSSPKPTEQSLEAKSQKSEDPTKQAQTQLKETVKGVTLKTEPKTGLPVLEPAKSEQLPKGSPVPTAAKPTQPAQVQPIQQPPKPQEQSRRFSLNIGGIIETPKPQPTTPQETVTGKLFGFGSSFFSQASNLINMADKPAEQPAPVAKQQPPSQPVTRQQPPKEASSAQSSPKLPPAKKETQPPVAQKPEQPVVGKAPASGQEKKSVSEKEVKPPVEATKTMAGSSAPPAPPKSNCPLCKVELNIGSKDPPNFTTCTECKNVVCNLCGFNPMPHLTEKEWLCLNCQTQRALTGQLGDMGKMTPPMPVSVKPAAKQPPGPKIQPGPTEQPPTQKSTEVITEPTPIQVQQKKEEEPYKGETPTVPVIEKKEEKIPPKQLTRTPSLDKTPPQKPKDISQPEVKIDKNEKASVTEPTKPLPDTPQKTDQVEQKKETDAPAVQKLDKTTPPLQVSKQAEGGPTTEPAETSLSRTQEKKHMTEIPVEAQSLKKPIQVETVKEKPEKEDDKSDTSGSSQQKSPQGLSDTGYSSDGISSSLGEIPSLAPSDEKDLLKEPSKKDLLSQESSPSSPSDLAKLESTVLSILEAQTSTVEKDPYSLYCEQERDRHRSRTLPITPESCSSDEEDLEDIQEVDEEALEEEDRSDVSPRKYGRKGHDSKNGSSASRQRYDSIEDSSESEHSPLPQRKKRMSIGSSSSDEYKEEDSQGSGDEDFIRKQIIGMSADEDASASDDDDYIRTQIKGISAEQKKEHEDRKSKGKSTAGKSKRLTKKSSTSHEDDPGRRHSWHDRDQEEEVYDESLESKFRETKSQENEELSISSGGGLRRFKTIELNSTTATPYIEGTEKQGSQEGYEGELEMESLTDSPEDRSRGEGSSSLQASSFTPGTSPTSVSSLDEDSDSSPSHKKMSGESKQQRKARHRAHGQVLPTIEDSSEEEELREEEELLMEQEKQRELEQQQRKSSSRKSKKDKDELRAQRRRERPKTPPSNLSPIEDASPTEELRQAAEMEELHRSSCSEYSPSIESEPEGFEISPDKILAVQKVYKLPTSVSLYSPTDEKNIDISQKATTPKSLKCADEVYEEMMQKAKLLQSQKETDVTHEKEPLYGGMLIEDYIYESLVEDTYSGTTDSSYLTAQQESSKGEVQEPGKKLRSPDQVFDDMMQKKNYQTEEEYYYSQPSNETLPQHAMSLPPSVSKTRQVSDSKGGVEPSTKEEKPLLDADAAYEELMKRQRAILTPGTSPTQPTPVSSDLSITSSATGFREIQGESIMSAPITGHEPATCTSVVVVTVAPLSSTIYPIPDVTITQHFTADEDIEEVFINEYASESQEPHSTASSEASHHATDISIRTSTASTTSTSAPTVTSSMTSPTSVVCETPISGSTPIPVSMKYTHPPPPPPPPVSSSQSTTGIVFVAEVSSATKSTAATTTSADTFSVAKYRDSVIVDIPSKAGDSTFSKSTPVVTSIAPPASEAEISSSVTTPTSVSVSLTQVSPTTAPLTVSPSIDHVVISVPGLDSSTDVTHTVVREPAVTKSEVVLKPYEPKTTAVTCSTGVAAARAVFQVTSTVPSASTSSISSTPSPIVVSISPLPVVPLYNSSISTTVSTAVTTTVSKIPSTISSAPSISSQVFSFFRSSSQESAHVPVPSPPPPPPPPPLPPPTLPKPSVYHKKKPPVSTPALIPTIATVPVSTTVTYAQATIITTCPSPSVKGSVIPIMKTPVPPPVPPKPVSIPAGLMFGHRTVEGVKPPIAPKPGVAQPTITTKGYTGDSQARSFIPPSTTSMTLNLIAPAECKFISPSSPMSPYSNKSSPRYTNSLHETYVVITLPSEPGTPTESITTQASLGYPPKQQGQSSMSPMPFTQYIKSVESQEVMGPDKYVSSVSHVYSSVSTSAKPPVTLPNLVAQVVTTEVQRTTVSLVHERLPTTNVASVVITIPPETAKHQQPTTSKENGNICDVIDLRTLTKLDVEMTDKGMDLSPVFLDSRQQSWSSEGSGRQTSAVQPGIVNLSTGSTPVSTLAVVTESITIVTCTATIAAYSSAGERPMGVGHSMSMPLQLTTSKPFEPIAQITYRTLDTQSLATSSSAAPINLSFGTAAYIGAGKPLTVAPTGITNGFNDVSTNPESVQNGAVDLSTTKPLRTMVAVNESTSEVVTTIIEEDDKPVDLTAGRRAVCCDVVYKFPFGGICTSQQPATTLPEDRFGYRDDHYQYDRPGPYGMRGVGSMKPSMSETNLAEAGLFLYKSKNSFDYHSAVTEGAVDLTSGRLSAGEVMNYSSKSTGPYPETRQVISGTGISIPQYSQARIIPPIGTQYGVNSVLRSSNGVVYSSVAAPVPSTFAITTQPGSVFSTTYKDWSGLHTSDTMPSLSSLQNQPLPRSYSFLTTTAGLETSLQSTPLETLMTGQSEFIPTVTTASESYTDASLDAIALSLEALASPISYDESKQQQYQMERELLELEKLKQLRLAEELEWERQEIQRFREQDKLIVQQELEELHTMKHQLLLQQEEERHAHLMMQQETFAQQQMQLEQIQQLQHQLQQQLEEQKIRQIYQYSYDPSGSASPQTSSEQVLQDTQYKAGENGQYWPIKDETATSSAVSGIELQQNATWYTVPSEGIAQFIPSLPNSVSEMLLKDIDVQEDRQPRLHEKYEEPDKALHDDVRSHKKIVDSGVQTDDEDGVDRSYTGRRRRTKKSVDTSVQTDDEDQEEWDIPTRSRRRSRVSKYSDGTETDKNKHNSKVSSIAIQTVTEISVQTEPVGTIRTPSIRAQMDTKVDIKKHISASEKTYKGSSLSCQTETDADKQTGQYSPQKDKKRPTPLEIGYSTHLKADSSLQVAPSPPKSPKVLYSPISPVSPSKSLEFVPYEKALGAEITPQKMATSEASTAPPPSPRTMKMMQRSMSDPKPLSPTADESTRPHFQYSDGYSTKGSQSGTPSGTQKKVKRTLPNPPPEEDTAENQSGYTTVGSVSRRRICRTNTMARAKILQDIDRELDLVERESSKLRKKQAELDEEEKEIDAKLRYLEMGINRRKDALLKEREKRERAYLQGVAEERDYMSDSEISNIRGTRVDSQHGLERPRTAPQSEFDQFMPPQTQPESEYAEHTSPYTQYQYAPPSLPTQAPSQYPQQTHYQQQSLYHQQISPYQTQPSYSSVPTISYPQAPLPQSQQPNYQHPSQMLLMQKPRQTTLADLEPKITTNYEVIRNQPLMIVPSSTETTYAVPHMGSKYNNLDLRIGLDERSSMVSSPISNISADSFYAEIEQHTPRNYVLIDDIGELTKGSTSLSSTFNIPDKDLTKTDRLLRTGELRRTPEVTDFLGPLQTSSRMHTYGKADEDPMEDPYELKVLKQQIKQEFRRGTEGLDHMSGLPHYYQSDSSYRHFPKTEKYSISRLTLEKQAAKQLPSSVLYQKQTKQKKPLMDPKVTKFSPIQESRDIEPDYSNYLASSTSSVRDISSRAKLLQDDITFGLRKNISDQQKYLGSTLGANLAHSLGNALNLVPNMRSSLHDDLDKPYPSGTRSRPSSRPSSVYGLDLSIKRDSSSTSLRLKTQENEPLDVSYTHASPSVRTKPTSLPISQSRGRIPIVAQNSEEESPLSPVGQPMGMARAAAGPLPPISADTREQFGSSHSLPEVQQHMREESRTCGYDRDIAFIMDDFQHAMSDSEECGSNNKTIESSENTLECNPPLHNYAYHLRREETDWFDKPRESRIENGHALDRRLPERMSHSKQSQHQQGEAKPIQYSFPYSKIKLQKDPKDHSVSGNGLGIRVVGGKDIPGNNGEIGAYIAKILPGGIAEQTGKVVEGMQVLEWNGISLIGKTYEEVQSIVGQQCGEAEICVRLDLNMLSDSKNPEHLELQDQTKAAERQRSPGVDPKQLAAELQKVSQQQSPSSVTSATEKGTHIHSGTPSAASSAVPSPGQPGSPSVSKKRHSSKPAEASKSHSHPITGEIQLQVNYDKHLGNLIVHVLQARNLAPRDNNGYSDPFVKVYLLPGRGQVMVVQNASVENKRRTKYVQKSLDPEWNQTVIYKNIHMEQLKKKTLEVTVWDYDRFSSNDFLGEVLIDLSNTSHLDSTHRWYPLKEQSESIDHGKSHSGQSSQQSPKPSVSKSRSHGIFPDPSKDMQVPTIEKSHSSPGSSKSSSEGHLRSHGPSRSQSKTSVTQTHLEDAGAAIAAAEAAVQQLRLQPTVHKSGLASHAKKQHRHSIAGVLPIQRTQSDNLPSPAKESKDTSQLAIRKVMSEGSPKPEGARSSHRATDSSVSTASSISSFGSGYSVDSEGSATAGENNIFPAPRMGKTIPNGSEKQQGLGLSETEGKTQIMGEIKIALKKEMKTEGEQLVVEILQCRNITYKFKSPDHLPDLYVKLYVINVATQKRVIKKKTRVCRHDREPSFNETFRFSMNPAGHSIQMFLVSNGGKFMKKTLIGEAYIWLDKVDLRKKVVNWHKLLVSSTQSHA
ncbi:protein piccolo-like isoform X5 [Acipenser ruthenus]|uniref:protein piccolo-like isoform X5 n=1 Tax=Acipenser ruthenus TaxID=7906 RepID=UPI002741BCC9|nr:protein piccolo-like isoform X5 [Acipenser ruthenus]